MRAVLAGFENQIFDAQRAFRAVLTALSEPGRPVRLPVELPPLGLAPSAAAAMLALADIDTPVWLSPSLNDLRTYLRFHTGAGAADDCGGAVFGLAADISELPPLVHFSAGTAISPETSATLIVGVADFTSGVEATFTGPGLREPVSIAPAGFDVARWSELIANHDAFPKGVDLLLCCGEAIVGVPRSTRITIASTGAVVTAATTATVEAGN